MSSSGTQLYKQIENSYTLNKLIKIKKKKRKLRVKRSMKGGKILRDGEKKS